MLWGPSLKLWTFALFRVPLLFLVLPRVVELNDKRAVIRIPNTWRRRNHLGSFYFGTFAIGADACLGILALYWMQELRAPLSLVFKDFRANFLKRATEDVLFICEMSSDVKALVQKANASSERETKSFSLRAECSGQVVAEFDLGLSLKRK